MPESTRKKVLVTGATGLVGCSLVRRLLSMGNVDVIALSRSLEKLESCFEAYLPDPAFSYIAHDVSSPLELTFNPDVIFHAAGNISNAIISERPVDIIRPNILGTVHILEGLRGWACEGIKPRLVLFSSATVYGNVGDAGRKLTEPDTEGASSLEAPAAAYSEGKRMSEVICNAYHRQYGVDVVRVRLGYVYGPAFYAPDTAFYQFVEQVAESPGGATDLVVRARKVSRRDNIYVDDAIEGLIAVAESGSSGEAYNVASGGDLGNYASIDEMAGIIADLTGNRIVHADPGFECVEGAMLDNSKLKALGWSVKTSLKEGISKTLAARGILHHA